jgi:demethylmenaquinone methyltransferase/2-methoxy-6-polyprenyl-1,4-benzoquinol methylase
MDLEKIKRKYRRNVLLVRRSTDRLRREAVAKLALRLGDRVLDLGCGTGLSFSLLRAAVGDGGIVYGVDASPDMLDRARAKIAEAGWTNVLPVESDAECLPLQEPVDGVLCSTRTTSCCLRLRSRARSNRSGRSAEWLRPVPSWRGAGGVGRSTRVLYSLPAVATLDHTRSYEPFSRMRSLLTDFTVEERLLGSQYLAWGSAPGARR